MDFKNSNIGHSPEHVDRAKLLKYYFYFKYISLSLLNIKAGLTRNLNISTVDPSKNFFPGGQKTRPHGLIFKSRVVFFFLLRSFVSPAEFWQGKHCLANQNIYKMIEGKSRLAWVNKCNSTWRPK